MDPLIPPPSIDNAIFALSPAARSLGFDPSLHLLTMALTTGLGMGAFALNPSAADAAHTMNSATSSRRVMRTSFVYPLLPPSAAYRRTRYGKVFPNSTSTGRYSCIKGAAR